MRRRFTIYSALFYIKKYILRRTFTIYSALLNLDIKKYILRRTFTIYSAFLDIKNSISWYQEIIHIPWYQIIEFLISWNHFLIPRNRFLDIKKCVLFFISRNRILDIKKRWINGKTAPQNIFHDIKIYNSWYTKMKFIWYQEFYILISRILFLDIKK